MDQLIAAMMAMAPKELSSMGTMDKFSELANRKSANFGEALEADSLQPSTSTISKMGEGYAEAPDMSNYATIQGLQGLLSPHQQRPQPGKQMGQGAGMGKYLMGLLGG